MHAVVPDGAASGLDKDPPAVAGPSLGEGDGEVAQLMSTTANASTAIIRIPITGKHMRGVAGIGLFHSTSVEDTLDIPDEDIARVTMDTVPTSSQRTFGLFPWRGSLVFEVRILRSLVNKPMTHKKLARMIGVQILNVDDAATLLGIEPGSVRAAAYRKRISSVQYGGRTYFTRDDVWRYRQERDRGRAS